jgi:hypothetical protein
MKVEIAPQSWYQTQLDPEQFELIEGAGSTNLANIVGTSGDLLQMVLHCRDLRGAYSNSWKGDLASGWLSI